MPFMRFAAAGVVGLVTVLLGGAPVAAAGDEAALFGKKYHSVSVTKDGKPKPLVEGTHLWVKFRQGGERASVAWRAGCNFYGARLEIEEDVLDVKRGSMVSTDMGCIGDRYRRQDDFFAGFFAKDPSWSATGDDLTLATERVTIELSRK